METMTVYFGDPFWIAVLEQRHDGRVRAVRQVFGAEPTDAELYQYLLCHRTALLVRVERAAAVADDAPAPAPIRNPKRLARDAARAARRSRPTTAAQEAVKKDLELRVQTADQRGRQRREEHAERRRQVRRAKSRVRHRGR
ncbi:YjdF family protein [Planosporangium thailandense]|uniref:YjdF family protein n=1 Tax=Planosporangium thailandense TaxID=765197 RepID=A0ABX0YAG3_9ACTN|nr:DUF2992 family protein [Planosporangium thailandense]NJC74239.1 YjdF family protein [Planosporangium thailandense]